MMVLRNVTPCYDMCVYYLVLGVLLDGGALVLPLDAGGGLPHVEAVEHEVGLPGDGEDSAEGDDAGAHCMGEG